MTSNEISARPSGFERSPGCYRRCQNSRLRVYRQSQFVIRSLEAEAGHFDAEDTIRFFKDLASRRLCLSQLSSHSDLLRTLSWKYESGLHRCKQKADWPPSSTPIMAGNDCRSQLSFYSAVNLTKTISLCDGDRVSDGFCIRPSVTD